MNAVVDLQAPLPSRREAAGAGAKQIKGGCMRAHPLDRHAEAGFNTVFINEAAYYPEEIAFSLTRPVTLEQLLPPHRSTYQDRPRSRRSVQE